MFASPRKKKKTFKKKLAFKLLRLVVYTLLDTSNSIYREVSLIKEKKPKKGLEKGILGGGQKCKNK